MILKTKLQIPPLRQKRVSRPRLLNKLNQILGCKLTLIVAPAGFGKTTLIREWIDTVDVKVGWLSLDSEDYFVSRFLLYLIHMCQTVDKSLGMTALSLLESAQSPDYQTILTSLLNDLASNPLPVALIFDDYGDVSSNVDIQPVVEFFLNNLPENAHLVILSRTQPQLTIARQRAQAQVIEIGSADLRFTAIEAVDFLEHVMQIDLPETQLHQLERKTEGWVAGLQLASLSLRRADDVAIFVDAFTGTNQLIEDYLAQEVLNSLTDEVREFLLATSIVPELCADLANDLTARTDSQGLLEQLDDAQLFLMPLDHQRDWYRYQNLFREFLMQSLRVNHPNQLLELGTRASHWYEQQGRLDDALSFAELASDDSRIATLLEILFERRDWIHHDMKRLVDSIERLPEQILERNIPLYLNYVWLKFESFAVNWDDMLSDLTRIDSLLTTQPSTYPERETQLMLAQVDMLRANHARHENNSQAVIDLCQQVLDRLPDDEGYIRSGAIAHMASAYETMGDLRQASDIYRDGIRLCQKGGNVDGLLFASWRLMETLLAQDKVSDASDVYDDLTVYHDRRTGPDMGAILIALGEVCRRQGLITQARQYLEKGMSMTEPFPAWQESTYLGQGRLVALDEQFTAIDDLTEREIETLRLLASDISTNDIAHQLSVSMSTIRTYCKRIYSKLSVHSRAEAVYRARELNIL